MAYFWLENRIMKRVASIWIVLLGTGLMASAQSDIFAPVKDAIKAGDATALTKQFVQSVEVELDGNTYGKVQSEFVLKEFFKAHPVNDFIFKHNGSSEGGLRFAIYSYISGSDSYTVLVRVRQVDDKFLIHKIKFEKD